MKRRAVNELRKMLCFLMTLVLCVALNFSVGDAGVNTGSKAIGFYSSDHIPAIAKTGQTILATCAGYTVSGTVSESTAAVFYAALESYDVVFFNGSGAAGRLYLSSGNKTTISGNSIKSKNLSNVPKLVYISASYSGKSSDTYGDICSAISSVGSGKNAVIAFTGAISYTSASDGIQYFNQNVIGYMANGTQLYQAIVKAKALTYEKYGAYYGAGTCTFSGNGALEL